MSDKKWIVVFLGIGLVLAYAASGPLRHPKQGKVGTPLRGGSTVATDAEKGASSQNSPVYAEGQILLDEALQKKAHNMPVLFIMAKAPEMKGAPIAVKKIDHPHFPLEFALTQADSPFGDNFYDGDIVVTARLDQDGSAGPQKEGDIDVAVEIKKGTSRKISLTLK